MTSGADNEKKDAAEKPAAENKPADDKPGSPTPKKPEPDRWGFFAGIQSLLTAFPLATTGQKVAIVAMSLGAVMFIGLGLVSVAIGAWAVVTMFSLAIVLIFATAAMLFLVEQKVKAPFRCRHVPVYPPDKAARKAIRDGLEEIQKDAVEELGKKMQGISDNRIRANIFMLAQIVGGAADGTWKLAIHPDFAINMNHPPELQLQLSIGQGATGVAYRDGTYLLTRRLTDPKQGDWEQKFHMTPELNAQIHKSLKWIVTFPLLRPGTREAIGVLNIDGLTDVPDDDVLNEMASSVRNNVDVIANYLALQHSSCIGIDQLGVM